jgi:hypothetical protein
VRDPEREQQIRKLMDGANVAAEAKVTRSEEFANQLRLELYNKNP